MPRDARTFGSVLPFSADGKMLPVISRTTHGH
jgi:hypothetical protein